jgi:para-nitrobenzyl esterase
LGSGSQPLYDGEELARRGVVLITINYRLGPFGFLRLNELTRGRMPSSGLEGLLDQIAALQWVGDNASAFGGDADNVTIFGESAGAFSVCCLMTMPRANGLFRRAIAQSGGANTANSIERAQLSAKRFVSGIKDADSCYGVLERATTDDILAAARKLTSFPAAPDEEIGVMPFQPVIDGDLLPDKPILAMRRGIGSRIDMIAGSTANEWLLFSEPSLLSMTGDQFTNWCERRYGASAAAKMLRSYSFANSTPPLSRLALLETDRVFGAPVGLLVDARAAHNAPTFRYRFDHGSPIFGGSLKACHTIELGFVFGTHKLEKYQAFFGAEEAEAALANALQTAWTSFASLGQPALPGDTKWPDSLHSREAMIFDSDQTRWCTTALYEPERLWTEYSDTLVGHV